MWLQVRLVGWDGNGHLSMHVPPATLLQYLHVLKSDTDSVMLSPHMKGLVGALLLHVWGGGTFDGECYIFMHVSKSGLLHDDCVFHYFLHAWHKSVD